jgi:hypothetical protein
MPEGFRVTQCFFPEKGAPTLGKDCKAAHYLIWTRNKCPEDVLLEHLKNHFGEDVLFAEVTAVMNATVNGSACVGEGIGGKTIPRVSIVLANPAKNGIGGWVKALVAAEDSTGINGWQDVCIVRTGLGHWNGVRPLMEEGIACLRIEA